MLTTTRYVGARFSITASCSHAAGRNRSWNRDRFFESSQFSVPDFAGGKSWGNRTYSDVRRRVTLTLHLQSKIFLSFSSSSFFILCLFGGGSGLEQKHPAPQGNPWQFQTTVKPLCSYCIHRSGHWLFLQFKGFFVQINVYFLVVETKLKCKLQEGKHFVFVFCYILNS